MYYLARAGRLRLGWPSSTELESRPLFPLPTLLDRSMYLVCIFRTQLPFGFRCNRKLTNEQRTPARLSTVEQLTEEVMSSKSKRRAGTGFNSTFASITFSANERMFPGKPLSTERERQRRGRVGHGTSEQWWRVGKRGACAKPKGGEKLGWSGGKVGQKKERENLMKFRGRRIWSFLSLLLPWRYRKRGLFDDDDNGYGSDKI